MIVVTGAAGFIGSTIVWQLNQQGEEEILVVDVPESAADLPNLAGLKYRWYVEKDAFLNDVTAGKWDAGLRAVVHMGACSSTTETDADFLRRNNYEYTRELALASLRAGARFINASSAATYGDGSAGYRDDENQLDRLQPLNLYARSKHDFDCWAREQGLFDRLVCLKYFNVYGPNEWHKGEMRSMVCKAYEQIRDTGKVRLFASDRPEYEDGGQQRDFVYVKDAVDMTLWFFDHPEVNGIFNVGTGEANNWNTLIGAVFRALDLSPNIEYVAMPEHLKGKYQYHTCAEMAKLRRAGYDRPLTPIDEAVRQYVQDHLVTGQPLGQN